MQSESKQNASYTPALLNIRSHIRARSGLLYRALSLYLVIAHLSMYVLPVGQLLAEPVPVPVLKSPKFESTDMDPYFEKAKQTRTASMWDSVISEGLTVLRAAWESAVELEFETELTKVNQSDAYNDTENYQDYIKKSLEMQREQAAAEWESSAASVIELRREQFLRAVSEQISEDASTESEKSLNRTNTEMADLYRSLPRYPGQAEYRISSGESTLDLAELTWKRDYNQRMDQGLSEYAQGLQTIEEQYALYMGALDEGEARFETNRAIISHYEQQVRDGIEQSLSQMEQMLASNGMFYDQNGDLNTSGNELAALIVSVKQKLDSGAKLSEIATEMTQYLDTQKDYAAQQEAIYREAIRGNQAFSETIAGQGAATINDERVQAVKKFLETGNPDDLNTYLRSRGETRIVEGMNSADVVGSTPIRDREVWLPVPGTDLWIPVTLPDPAHNKGGSLASGATFTLDYGTTQSCTKSETTGGGRGSPVVTTCLKWGPVVNHAGSTYLDAFYYWENENYCSSSATYRCNISNEGRAVAEETVDIRLNYRFYDPAAEANANTWLGYVNQLSPFLDQWTNTILPAIETWEEQVAEYDASYAAWKEDADAKRQTAQETFETAYQTLLDDRKDWLSAMEEEQRRGKKGWLTAQNSFAENRQAFYTTQDEQTRTQKNLLMTLSTSMDNAIETASNTVYGKTAAVPDVGAKLGSLLSGLPELKADFLNASSNNLPDLKHVQTALDGFEAGMKGALNIAVSKASEEHMLEMRKQTIEVMKQQLNPLAGLNDDQLLEQGLAMGFGGAACEGAKDAASCAAGLSEKDRDQILTAVKDYRDKTQYEIEERPDGSLRAVRKVPTGDAMHVKGDGTNPDDYKPVMMDQVLEIAAPAYGKMSSGGNLFADWDYDAIGSEFENNLDEYVGDMEQKLQGVASINASANEFRQNREEAYQKDVEGKMAVAEMWESIKQSMIESMLGGMGGKAAFQSAVRGYVEGQVKSFWAEKIADATGLDASFISAFLGAKMGGLKTGDALKSAVKSYVEDKLWEKAAQDSGNPEMVYTLRKLIGIKDAQKAKAKAKQQQQIQTAVTVAAVVATVATGGAAGVLLSAAIQGVGNAAVGYMNGGLKGALVSGVSAAASAYASGGGFGSLIQNSGIGVNLTYSDEAGFGGSVSVGKSFGGLNVGGSLNFQQGQKGVNGGGLNIGYQTSGGHGFNANVSFDRYGNGQGGSIGYSYTPGTDNTKKPQPLQNGESRTSNTFNLGVKLNEHGRYTGADLSVKRTTQSMIGNKTYSSGLTGGIGLGNDRTYDFIVGSSAAIKGDYDFGFNKFGTDLNTRVKYGFNGDFIGLTQTIDVSMEYQSQAVARDKLEKLHESILKNEGLTPAQKIDRMLETAKEYHEATDYEGMRQLEIDRLQAEGALTYEQARDLRRDPGLIDSDPSIAAAIENSGRSAPQRTGFFGALYDDIAGGIRSLTGYANDSRGHYDGQYHFRRSAEGYFDWTAADDPSPSQSSQVNDAAAADTFWGYVADGIGYVKDGLVAGYNIVKDSLVAGYRAVEQPVSDWWNEVEEKKAAEQRYKSLEAAYKKGEIPLELLQEEFDVIVTPGGDGRVVIEQTVGGFLGFGGTQERIEFNGDGTVNVLQQDDGFLQGFLGTRDYYVNGEELLDGDTVLRDRDNKLDVIQQSAIRSYLENHPDKRYLFTQNGVGTSGLEAVGLNDAIRTEFANEIRNSGENFGGSITVFNNTVGSGFLGDAANLIGSYGAQLWNVVVGDGLRRNNLRIGGAEKAYDTWRQILASGNLQNGGLIVAHSQGAQIVTQALNDHFLTYKDKTDAVLITLGGAHTSKPTVALKHMYDVRNSPDLLTGVFHKIGDLRPDPGSNYTQIREISGLIPDAFSLGPYGFKLGECPSQGGRCQVIVQHDWKVSSSPMAVRHTWKDSYLDSFKQIRKKNEKQEWGL